MGRGFSMRLPFLSRESRAARSASRTPAGVNLKPRRMGFTLAGGYTRDWAHGDPLKTSFLNAVSCILPMGEDFFLQAMRAVREQIRDPQLAKDARAFCGQEGHHAYEHRKFNALLAASGYPRLADIDRVQDRINDWILRHTGALDHVAFTAGAEHMTSIMSHAFLSDPLRWVDARSEIGAMLFWHTVEEIEHKSVCLDVLQHLDDSYARRMAGFALLTGILAGSVLVRQAYMLAADGQLSRPSTWAQLARFYLGRDADGKPGVLPLLLADYLQYLRPDFHPWEADDRYLVAKWVQAFDAGHPMLDIDLRDYLGDARPAAQAA